MLELFAVLYESPYVFAAVIIALVIIMYVMGGAGLHAFNYALLAGILFGTYSSVAVASPMLMGFRKALVTKVAGTADKQ